MRWTNTTYPKEFEKLSQEIRESAILIGNQLLRCGNPKDKVIKNAIEIAKGWWEHEVGVGKYHS